MLQRYLGNKSFLVGSILELVRRLAEPGELVCDAFSGSLAVSVALKNAGYRVASNDINLFSWVYAQAYLANAHLPQLPSDQILFPQTDRRFAERATSTLCDEDNDAPALAAWKLFLKRIISPYQDEIPSSERRTDFFDHYCEAGRFSAFTSSRGQSGRRRFFTSANARCIDRALSRIRWWWRTDQISTAERCFLAACLLDAIEKVSNTQGTYHDFPRSFYDPRALRPIKILPPNLDALIGPINHIVGKAQDSLEFVQSVPRHSVMYIDPPYNFRQYTAYYFLPNLVAAYPEIDDLDDYFANVSYVRGQNPADDFASTFCSAQKFMPSMTTLIKRARCRYVVISYFDGKNHWSDFKSKADSEGRSQLERFLSGPLFVSGTLRCFPVERLNYQSYGGYKARTVNEFLFVAEKAEQDHVAVGLNEVRLGMV